MNQHTLVDVPTGEAYSNISGAGNYVVKVRAITRTDTGVTTTKRGVAFETANIQDIPEFILNVYKNWDGRGELQYHTYDSNDLLGRTSIFLPAWTTIS